jgi:hypothetical protein
MSLEKDVSTAVQLMFRHAKNLVDRNVAAAVRNGDITIDESKLPGLSLIIQASIDDAFKQSIKQLVDVTRKHEK